MIQRQWLCLKSHILFLPTVLFIKHCEFKHTALSRTYYIVGKYAILDGECELINASFIKTVTT